MVPALIFTMDTFPTLNVASAILAVVASGAELISSLNKSQGQSLPDGNDDYPILETLRTRRLTLSTLHGTMEQQLSAGISQLSSDGLALHGLALSCLEDSGSLMKEVENKPQDSPGRERLHAKTDRKDWSSSALGDKFDRKKVEWLSRAVSVHVSSIIRCVSQFVDISELAGTNIRC